MNAIGLRFGGPEETHNAADDTVQLLSIMTIFFKCTSPTSLYDSLISANNIIKSARQTVPPNKKRKTSTSTSKNIYDSDDELEDCSEDSDDETFLGDSDSEDIEDSSEYNDFEDFEKSYYSNYSNGNELEIQVSKTNIISLFNSNVNVA